MFYEKRKTEIEVFTIWKMLKLEYLFQCDGMKMSKVSIKFAVQLKVKGTMEDNLVGVWNFLENVRIEMLSMLLMKSNSRRCQSGFRLIRDYWYVVGSIVFLSSSDDNEIHPTPFSTLHKSTLHELFRSSLLSTSIFKPGALILIQCMWKSFNPLRRVSYEKTFCC